MTNEELAKIAWTRELTDERVRVAAAYWLDASPHERTEADGITLARYARKAMEEIESLKTITDLAVKALKEIESSQYVLSSKALTIARSALSEISGRLTDARQG